MPHQVNEALMAATGKAETIFLHCLPAERGKETTDGVMESAQSHVFRQARAPRLPMAHHAHPDRAAGRAHAHPWRVHMVAPKVTHLLLPTATSCYLLLSRRRTACTRRTRSWSGASTPRCPESSGLGGITFALVR